jgi:hypothetical protein
MVISSVSYIFKCMCATIASGYFKNRLDVAHVAMVPVAGGQ